MLGVLKLFCAIILLPIVVASTVGFGQELSSSKQLNTLFMLGVYSYTICHLFVLSFARLFDFSQKVFGEIFRFQETLRLMVPRIVPLGPILLLVIYYICSLLFGLRNLAPAVVFASGFALTAHIILTADSIYHEDEYVLKSHYFLSMTLIYVLNLIVVALLLDLNFAKFSCPGFIKYSSDFTIEIYELLLDKFIL